MICVWTVDRHPTGDGGFPILKDGALVGYIGYTELAHAIGKKKHNVYFNETENTHIANRHGPSRRPTLGVPHRHIPPPHTPLLFLTQHNSPLHTH